MNATQITDHSDAAKARLLEQYKGIVSVEGLLDSLGGQQVQDLEDAIYGLKNRLDIDVSEGIQLDDIGEIVGQDRQGQGDEVYKLLIKARIGKNVSESEIERVISVWKIITQSTVVHLIEVFPAEVAVYGDVPLDPSLITLAIALIQDVVGAGIKVTPTVVFSDEPFGFEGDPAALGFSEALSQGQADGTTSFKLIDSGANFTGDGVDDTMLAMNDTDGTQANILSVDGPGQLTLDTDIFVSGEDYYINANVGGELSYIQGV